jgi:hypothetical protein
MSRRIALAGLSLISMFFALDWAQGDQIFSTTSQSRSFNSCQIGADRVRCTHFEGYVVVRRHDATPQAAAAPEAVLSANRLYLHVDDDKTP